MSDPESKWELTLPEGVASIPPGELLAWAKDIETGQPRYIHELKRAQTGANCGCICPACKEPLLAINAGRTEFIIRPHFRHPSGTHRDSCSILVARAAALATFKRLGYIDLPARRVPGTVTGLSGAQYSAVAELPHRRSHISAFSFVDMAKAILTLDDGRELLVEIIGRAQVTSDEPSAVGHARLQIVVNDPAVAALSPYEIAARLQLVGSDAWCQHWEDVDLRHRATTLATESAIEHLDWLAQGLECGDVTPADLRATLLHNKAQEILAAAGHIILPALDVVIERRSEAGLLFRRNKSIPESRVMVLSAQPEVSVGDRRPDVVAKTLPHEFFPFEKLLIEVTVSNIITPERIASIALLGIPAIEVDLSQLSGRLTESQFRSLLVDQTEGKRWIFHPQGAAFAIAASDELDREIEVTDARARKANQPIADLATQYLKAFRDWLEIREIDRDRANNVEDDLRVLGGILAARGYPHASTELRYLTRTRLLSRLMSIQNDTSVGYAGLRTSWQVINAILQDGGPEGVSGIYQPRQWHTVYLMAIRVYAPTLNAHQATRVSLWRDEVAKDLAAGGTQYRRPKHLDALLALLFPELAGFLKRPLPTPMTKVVDSQIASKHESLWLKGDALEAWQKAHPEAAEWWRKPRDK